MLVVDGKELDPRNAFTIIDKSVKDVVAKVLDPKGALKTNGSLFTGVDAKVYHLRDALETNGTPFTVDDVTVPLPLGMPSINIDTPAWLMELRDSEPSSGRLYSLTAWRIMKVKIRRRRMLGGLTNQRPRKRPTPSDDRKGGLSTFCPQLEQLQ